MMTDFNQDLAALWQQQPVPDIDTARIKRDFTWQQRKQRLYITVDVLSMVPMWLILYFNQDALPAFTFWACIFASVTVIPFIIYLIWLRRHAAFARSSSTQAYLAALKQQLNSNIKIARITKHSCWVTALYLLIVNGGSLWWGGISDKPSFSYFSFSLWLAGGIMGLIGTYVFFAARERKFRRKKAELAQLVGTL